MKLGRLDVIAVVATLAAASSRDEPGFRACTAYMQQSALSDMTELNCEPRQEVVKIYLPNASHYSLVIPDRVSVKRCGGSCGRRFHSCRAGEIALRDVKVLLMPRTRASGVAEAQCGVTAVEEHRSCSCGCSATAERDCVGPKKFVRGECRCVCVDDEARSICHAADRYWDESACRCFCFGRSDWPACPSGHVFNPTLETCACVPLSEYASVVFELLTMVLLLSVTMTGFGLVHCYRTHTGLFRDPDPNPPERNFSDVSIVRSQTRARRREEFENSKLISRSGCSKKMFALFLSGNRDDQEDCGKPCRNDDEDETKTMAKRIARRQAGGSRCHNLPPLSQTTSRSQSDASMMSGPWTEMSVLSSPSQGPSRVTTIAEALDLLDEEVTN